MKKLLNTLFVTTPGTYLHIDHDTVCLELEKKTIAKLPILHFSSVVCIGEVMVSPKAMARFASEGRQLTFLDRNGRFLARVEGPTSGNILLRKSQFQALSNEKMTTEIAKWLIAGKIQNCRNIIMRITRELEDSYHKKQFTLASRQLKNCLEKLKNETLLDGVRGVEGEAAQHYFAVFDLMVKEDKENFFFKKRSRRPPKDKLNALLSFLYTLLVWDCNTAAQGVGLDPQAGFLHAIRPGRPALALDLMEEFRPLVADRLALALINRKQVTAADFSDRPGGAVYLSDEGRKKVIVAYQKRKQDEVSHPLLKRKIPLGLVPHIQARIFARFLRGDIDCYVPFVPK